jgi:hypothetical protein
MSHVGLFARLEEMGWTRQDDTLVAPNGTMWLDTANPWPADLKDLKDNMESRRERVERFLDTDPDTAGPDLAGVLQILEVLRELVP